MSDATSIIEALYKNFLLRDLFAKIVPGAVVLIATAYQSPFAAGIVKVAGTLGWPMILVGAGAAWIMGFAIQEFGELFHTIRHHPPQFANTEERYKLRNEFNRIASSSETQQAERYAIIKEAAGNGATAILISVSIVVVRTLSSSGLQFSSQAILPSILLLLFAYALIRSNRNHARKHYKCMEVAIEAKKHDQ